ncbi:MAG TPA: SRPBCC family protein [Terracidiphilus sp.]|nr:SRPBCC family protein [Terracidiphilus sp.]
MAVIHLETSIDAPPERVFDLARSIDAHQDSTDGTSERAVAGVTSGLLGPEEEVTWEARHFGVTQRLRVKMTRFDRPRHFQDVMLQGAFRYMQHEHRFESREGRTVMTDRFEFQSPLGFLGRIVDRLILTGYMRRFIVKRNAILKQIAESEAWRRYLNEPSQAAQTTSGLRPSEPDLYR